MSHVVQTLTSENPYILFQDYVLDITHATTNIQHFVLICMRSFGTLGNSIFFVCSAWFLLESNNCKKRKIFFMVAEIWLVSIIILIITYAIIPGKISFKILIKCILPTTFSANWYMTCYMIFYAIHPVLNQVIRGMNKVQLFRSIFCLVALYIIADFVKPDLFFSSALILWGTIYFLVAYMKQYMTKFADNLVANVVLLLICIIGFVGLNLVTNVGGLYIPFLSDKTLHWASNCNPFLIGMAIFALNLARNIHFTNRIINYISGLSLLIYIIHENLILRSYFRPMMWEYVYKNYGYENIIMWVFALSGIVFLFGLVGAVLYSITIKKWVAKPIDHIYNWLRYKYLVVETRILN